MAGHFSGVLGTQHAHLFLTYARRAGFRQHTPDGKTTKQGLMASLGLDKDSPGAHGVGEMFSSARVFHGFLKTMKIA